MAASPDTGFDGFRGRYVVLKVGGTADVERGRIGADVRDLVAAGARVVIAHGGGDALSDFLAERGETPTWIDGLRVTSAATRDAAVMVFRGVVAPALIGELVDNGVSAVGIAGNDGDVIRVEQQSAALGYVGQVCEVRRGLLDDLTERGHVPTIAPLGLGPDGQIYNVNGDEIAGAVAHALRAEALLFLTDVPAVLDADGEPIRDLPAGRANALIAQGVIRDGMVPKVRAALDLLDAVDAVWITDGREPHAIRQTLVEGAVGTRIVA
ncbi:MAG: acetylglutamate kinase [Chloroflexota bacterium]|nr:acetylglutamate kinase [Chloroflexota bacterium]